VFCFLGKGYGISSGLRRNSLGCDRSDSISGSGSGDIMMRIMELTEIFFIILLDLREEGSNCSR